jgi:hypothetical protein
LFYSMSGEIARCRSYFDVALDEARRSDDPHTLLAALGNAYASLVHPVDWPLRATLAAEMLAIAEQVDDDDARFEALHLYFSTQVQFADPLLRTTFERQRSLGVSLRSAGRRWMAGYQDACLAYLDGRLDDSDAISTTWFERAPVAPSRALSTHFMNVIVVRLAQGRVDELARETDAIATEQAELPGWRAVAAWIAARRGDHDRVIHECDALDTGAGLPHDMSWSGATMWLGRAVAAAGDADRSRAITELIAPYTGWMTWYGSGTVGPFDLALAELALTAGDRGSAAHHLAVARSVVGRLGARVYEPDLDRLDARLAG